MRRRLKVFRGLILWALLTATSAYSSPSPVTITVGNAEYDLADTGFSVDIEVDDSQYILGAAFTVRYDTEHLTLTSVESSYFDTFAKQFEAADAYNDPPESVTVDGVTYNSPLVAGQESAAIGGSRIAGVRARSAGTNNTTLCTVHFIATGLEYRDTVSITVEPSVIDNEKAGYDASGEQTAMLVTQVSETSFEEIEVAAIVQGTVSVTDTSETQVSGTLSFDGQAIGNTEITVYSFLTGRTTTATTDDQGYFEVTLSNSESSTKLQISFSHADYGSYTTSLNVAEGSITANFTNDAPEKAVMVAVTGATVLTPTLETEAFYDASNGHQETEWQIMDLSRMTANGQELDDLIDTDGSVTDESFIVYWADSFTNLTALIVPDFYLYPDTSYAVRARFFDDCPAGSMSSEWSDFIQFRTQASPEGFTLANGVLVPEDQSLTEDELAAFEADVIGIRSAGENLNLGIIQPDNAEIRQLSSLSLDDMDDTAVSAMPEGLETPYGLVGFSMALDDDNSDYGTVTVTIYFDNAVSEDMTWWKYDALQQLWIDYTDYSEFSSDRTSVELTLKDGDYGDEDGVENGRIVDPGGVGTKLSSGINGDGDSEDSEGVGGSGCFIVTLSGNQAIKTSIYYFIGALLIALAVLPCLQKYRRSISLNHNRWI